MQQGSFTPELTAPCGMNCGISARYDEYMVTVANLVGNSGKIAVAKPHLIEKITNELLKVEHISITSHLTEECKRVIAEHAIKSFSMFFDRVEQKDKVIGFVSTRHR